MTNETRTDPTSTESDTAGRFRVELRTWLDRELTREVAAAGGKAPDEGDLAVLRDWNHRLADAGWAAPAWPTEHGGRGFNDELPVGGLDADLQEFANARAHPFCLGSSLGGGFDSGCSVRLQSLDQGVEQLGLVCKVMIEGATSHACAARDGFDPDLLIPL